MPNGLLAKTTTTWGKQYYYDKQYSKALKPCIKPTSMPTTFGARELICDNYEYSSMVYAAIGDYAQAYKYLEKMQHLSKELQSSNKLRNIELEISYKRYQDQKHATEMQEQSMK